MKKACLLPLLILMFHAALAQQDAQFTQYVFNGLHINPAYAGYKEDVYIQSFYRSQWEGVKGAPKTFAISVDGALPSKNVGLGLVVTNDKIGAQRYLSGFLNYAYRLKLGDEDDNRLAFGIAIGAAQLGIDGGELNPIESEDSYIPIGMSSVVVPDARFGIFYAKQEFFLGLSATNLLAKYMSRNYTGEVLVPIPEPHVYLTGGALFTWSEDVKFKPVVLLKEDFRGPGSLDISAYVLLKDRIWLGMFARTSVNVVPKNYLQNGLPKESAMGAVVEFFATESLRIGYSYDYSLNKLRNYNYGSHEISIGFYLKKADNTGRLRCYKF
jgi:type IX secretion system PorP/SprF family membrane protein